MLNNCPTIPEYKINACTGLLILDFELDPLKTYIVRFTNNVNQLYQIVTIPLPSGQIMISDFEFINDLYSPYLVDITEEGDCEPIELSHCGTDATQFKIIIEPVVGDVISSVTIPCCNA